MITWELFNLKYDFSGKMYKHNTIQEAVRKLVGGKAWSRNFCFSRDNEMFCITFGVIDHAGRVKNGEVYIPKEHMNIYIHCRSVKGTCVGAQYSLLPTDDIEKFVNEIHEACNLLMAYPVHAS